VPKESEITDSVTLASVRRGRALLRFTRESLPAHAGNDLQCVSCHADDGLRPNALAWVGVYARYPQYRSRSGQVEQLTFRINDCFKRSLNGKAIAPEGRDMRDIVAYLAYLSNGVPVGAKVQGQGVPALQPLTPDTASGARIFASTCSKCHGVNGEGSVAAPPVWGPRSYNIGAGMARLRTAAGFIREVMPFDNPGSLTPQQAFDVAAYIGSRPRPDYKGKELDWPYGDPPPDVAYPTAAAAARAAQKAAAPQR
jgi:thiosulfate dehydrogenase